MIDLKRHFYAVEPTEVSRPSIAFRYHSPRGAKAYLKSFRILVGRINLIITDVDVQRPDAALIIAESMMYARDAT